MSSFLTGSGRTYKSLNIDIMKSPSTSWASNSSSPSSTLSESNNSPLAISTRKPRTPRKRPNQTYNEAAAILSTSFPKLFPTKKNHSKFKVLHENITPQLFEPSDVFLPFQVVDNSSFLLHSPVLQSSHFPVSTKCHGKFEKQCLSPGEITSQGNLSEICDDDEYLREIAFDAESLLVEGVGEGLDSIMGNSSVENEVIDKNVTFMPLETSGFCYGYPVGMGFDFEYGMRKEFVANRNVDDGNWYKSPVVNVADITPKMTKLPVEKKKKKVEVKKLESVVSEENLISEESVVPQANAGLMLKLDYDSVLNAWSEKVSPFSGAEGVGNDVQTRLAQIDLFSENGGVREASVQRYKEKRRTRLFAKKIRYEVRKVNADRRPRMKGRFVRTPNSPDVEQD